MKCKNEKIFRQIKEILHQIKENIMNSSYLAFHSSWNLIICICTLVHIMYLYIWFKYLWKFSIYPHNIWIEVYSMMGQVTLLALTVKHVYFLSVLGRYTLPRVAYPTSTTCIYHIFWNLPQSCASFFFVIFSFQSYYGLGAVWILPRTTDTQWTYEGTNQRYLKIWADVADKICFVRT